MLYVRVWRYGLKLNILRLYVKFGWLGFPTMKIRMLYVRVWRCVLKLKSLTLHVEEIRILLFYAKFGGVV